MDALTLLLFVVGLGLLVWGADLVVRGAARLAMAVGITPVVVGLTVVAFGTSAPELAVSLGSAWQGRPDIALGNVVGSNNFNVLFILGVSALITPLVVHRQIVGTEVPIMIAASVLVAGMALDGAIGRLDGAVLAAGIIAYTVVTVRRARYEVATDTEVNEITEGGVHLGRTRLGAVGLVLAGLAMLVLGSRWLVDGAVAIAEAAGLSELVIGLTIVAGGTSLPEVATSVTAAIRGHRDIAVGNVIGSNIFNIGAVLGFAALFGGGIAVAPTALSFDIPVMVAVAVGCLPVFMTGHVIARWEGALFFGYYVAYTMILVFAATARPELAAFEFALATFVVPLTVITLAIGVYRNWRRGAAA